MRLSFDEYDYIHHSSKEIAVTLGGFTRKLFGCISGGFSSRFVICLTACGSDGRTIMPNSLTAGPAPAALLLCLLVMQMDRKGRIVFEFDRIEADLCGLKVPLPKFSQDAGFVEVQV